MLLHGLRIARLLSRAGAAVAMIIGGLVLAGWVFNVSALQTILPGLPPMVPNTALGLLTSGASLSLWRANGTGTVKSRLAWALAVIPLFLGLLTIAEYVFHQELGIDRIFFAFAHQRPATLLVGRSSPHTASVLTLLGLALILLETSAERILMAQLLAVSALSVCLVGLLGYLYGVPAFYSISRTTGMALHTAIGFAIMAMSLLTARPDVGLIKILFRSTSGGTLVRWLFPAVVIVPTFLGWLRIWGQKAGWYAAQTGIAVMVVATVLALATFAWLAAGALDRLNEQFRAVTDNANDAIVSADSRGRINYVNQAAKRMFGYEADQLVGLPLTVLMPPRFHERHQQGFERFLVTGESHVIGKSVELEGRRRDGSEFPLNLSLASWNAGQKTYFTGILQDISERNRMQAELDRFFTLSPDMLAVADFDGHFKRANPSWQRVLGYTTSELLAGTYWDIIHPDDKESVLAVLRSLAANQALLDFEFRALCKDGSCKWLSSNAMPYLSEEPTIYSVSRDVTDRKLAEQALRESEQRYRALFHLNPHPVWVYERETLRFLMVNHAAVNNYGYTEQEFLTLTIGDIHLAQDVPAMLQSLGADQDGKPGAVPWQHRTKDGRILNVDVSTHLFQFAGRNAVLAIAVDVTERKHAADQIYGLNQQLERRNIELTAVNHELETFSYSVSHDLRAPLRSVDGFSAALLQNYSEKLDQEGLEYLEYIRAAATRMAELIDDLLRLARTTSQSMSPQTVNLSTMVEEISCGLQQSVPDRPANFVIAPDLHVQGDQGLLRVALENLLGNAWKFTSKKSHTCIAFGKQQVNGEEAFFISDNGAGFDMRYADKLFGAFQRLHDEREFSGNGIGLATVQRVVHRHGGRIWAESSPGQGARFYFVLKTTADAQASPAGQAAFSKTAGFN